MGCCILDFHWNLMTFIFKETIWSSRSIPTPAGLITALHTSHILKINAPFSVYPSEMLFKGECDNSAHSSETIAHHPDLKNLYPALGEMQLGYFCVCLYWDWASAPNTLSERLQWPALEITAGHKQALLKKMEYFLFFLQSIFIGLMLLQFSHHLLSIHLTSIYKISVTCQALGHCSELYKDPSKYITCRHFTVQRERQTMNKHIPI